MRPSTTSGPIISSILSILALSSLQTTTASASASPSASSPLSSRLDPRPGPNLSLSLPAHPPFLQSQSALPPSTHATLLDSTGASRRAQLRRDHTLIFTALEPGSYLLDVHSRDLLYAPLRVDVGVLSVDDDDDDGHGVAGVSAGVSAGKSPAASRGRITVHQTFRGNEWANKGALLGSLGAVEGVADAAGTAGTSGDASAAGADKDTPGTLHIALRPIAIKQFYQQRAGFSLLSFFKSPMILMGLVTCVLVFGLPYLLNNMDPEMKAEMEDMQRELLPGGSSGTAAQLQNFDLASWMAGKAPVAGGTGSSAGSGTAIKGGTPGGASAAGAGKGKGR